MEDDRRPVLGEHLPHPLLLLAVGEHRDRDADVAVLLELAQDLEQVVLGVVDEHQPPRIDPGDLAAQLRADRAAGAGDEHDLAGQVGPDPLELHPHRLAAEDVLDPDLAQLPGDAQLTRAVGQQLEHGRGGADRDPALAAGGDDAAAQRAGRRRDRDHDLVGLELVEDPGQIRRRGRAEHLEPVLVLDALLARIVVDEADRPQAELRVADQLADDEPAAVAAADDEHVAGALGDADGARHPALGDEVDDEADPDQQRQAEQQEQRDHARRQRHRVERRWNAGVVCTGCTSAIAPTITTVATTVPLATAS